MINDRIFNKIDFYDSSSRGNVEVGREIVIVLELALKYVPMQETSSMLLFG